MLSKYVLIAVTTILNLVLFVHNMNYYITTPTNTPESNFPIPLNKHQSTVHYCTAELLLSDDEEESRWISLDGIWKWKVPVEAANACNLEDPFLIPLQSTTDDIQAVLDRKWLIIIGDSSVRMLHDYLIGRWLGNITKWPKDWGSNRGPDKHHSTYCGETVTNFTCHYDVYNKGARVTFVWNAVYYTGELQNVLQNFVGVPDVVVGQHGYWEPFISGDINHTAQEQKHQWSLKNAAVIPKKITEVLDLHEEMKSLFPQAYSRRIYKIWMSFFDKNALKDYDQSRSSKHYNGEYDGTKVAQQLGWDIFDRYKLTNIDGSHEDAHPINEVLEIELEVLLVILKNI